MNYLDQNKISFTKEEANRYSRHLSLSEIGLKGQKRLKESSVLCIGCGGLGSPVLLYLASAGVGTIGIVDYDYVEDSNLQRQVIYGTSQIGKLKVDSAKERLNEINPFCKINTYNTLLTNKNALNIISEYDLVCDCTDNFPSRYLINDACYLLGKPNIYAAVAKFEGQVSVFNLNKSSPNYRDLLPNPPPKGVLPSCAEGGVMGILPGIIGLIQATEAIKIITKIGDPLSGRLLVFNALGMSFKELNLEQDDNRYVIERLIDYEKFCSNSNDMPQESQLEGIKKISVKELKNVLTRSSEKAIIIDVRQKNEYENGCIFNSISIPLDEIENKDKIEEIRKYFQKNDLYIYCKSGKRSLKATQLLKKHGIEGINVIGGIDAWNIQELHFEE